MQLIILTQCVVLALVYGLELEPKPEDSRSTLIHYRSSLDTTSFHFINRLNSFLGPYTNPDREHTMKCNIGVPPEEGSNKVCDVLSYWGNCVSSNGYSYNSYQGGPCIFLNLHKGTNWIPEYYNSETIPVDMPFHIKYRIRDTEKRLGSDSDELKVVWVSCDGEHAADKENIGPIIYYPRIGFSGEFFPIINEEHYLSPLVAVHFEQPERGIVISIQCKAWARNLEKESVHFHLLVDY